LKMFFRDGFNKVLDAGRDVKQSLEDWFRLLGGHQIKILTGNFFEIGEKLFVHLQFIKSLAQRLYKLARSVPWRKQGSA
jgi:hypothetical protein